MRKAAMTLARAGWRIHPLVPNGKKPILDAWQKEATNDITKVDQWWSMWPKANIGIATGGKIVVVDLDVKHPPVDGIDEWGGYCVTHNIDDTTLTAQTPSGGLHLFFSKSVEIRNSAGKIAPGVDVRGDGGYVVAVPSVLDGKQYEWEMPIKQILPLPSLLVDKLKYVEPVVRKDVKSTGADCSSYVGAAIAQELDTLSRATNGTKHDTLNRCSFNIGQLLGSPWAHLDRETLEAQIWDVVERLPDVESYKAAYRTMTSALDAGMRNPRPEPQSDYPQPVTLYGQDTLKKGRPLVIVDDQDTAIMCLETVKDEIGVLAPSKSGVWGAAWSNLVAASGSLPVVVWMKELATSGNIANQLLQAGVKPRVYRGEAQDLKPWLRSLL